MEISKFSIYATIICVIIPYLVAKPVSLNDIIAAESKQKPKTATTQRPTTLPAPRPPAKAKPVTTTDFYTLERISFNEVLKLKPSKTKKLKKTDLISKSVSLNDILAAESKQTEKVKSIKKPILSDLISKSVSLNDILAAESKQTEKVKSIKKPILSDKSERLSLNKALKSKPRKSKKLNIPETILPRSSLLQFRKRFQIKSPLKPRTLKFVQKPRYKRRYQSIKQEKYRNEKHNKKYVPLLRSLSELFDNMLPSDSGESSDSERSQIKLRRNKSKDENESSCTCIQKSRDENPKSSEETAVFTTISTKESTVTQVAVTSTEISSTTPSNAALSNISDLGSNSDVSILLTRNTSSSGRDDSRLREGSGSTNHTSAEGNISRDNGNSECDTAHREDLSSSTDYEETSYSDTRKYAGGTGFESEGGFDGGRRLHNYRIGTRNPVYGEETTENLKNKEVVRHLRGDIGNRDDARSPVYRKAQETKENFKNNDAVRHFRGDIAQFKGKAELEMGRDEAKSTVLIPEFVPGFRGFAPMDEIKQKSQYVQSKEIYEKSVISFPDDNSSDKRFFDGDGTYTAENKKSGKTNATVISVKDLSNPIMMLQSPNHNTPYVTIIDGYSVARDKNGSNKLAEQSIRFHS